MPSLVKLLALCGSLMASIVLATPVDLDAAATKTTSCSPYITYTAKFDKLAEGAAPTPGFMSANWNGWTVTNPYGTGIQSKSGNLSIESSDAETATISTAGGVVMELKSFYFACIANFPASTEIIASPCSIMVTSLAYTHIIPIHSSGPYDYTVNYTSLSEGIPSSMKKVNLNTGSSEFYFQVVSGQSSSRIVLDNVVMVQQNDCPDNEAASTAK